MVSPVFVLRTMTKAWRYLRMDLVEAISVSGAWRISSGWFNSVIASVYESWHQNRDITASGFSAEQVDKGVIYYT